MFGNHEYKYGSVYHPPLHISNNKYVESIYNNVRELFPTLKFNSVLLNYYPNNHSIINLHADDEPDICPQSYILTLSFGSSRSLTFAHKVSRHIICTVNIGHGDFTIFSKLSQSYFIHGILDTCPDVSTIEPCSRNMYSRLSFTFRNLH